MREHKSIQRWIPPSLIYVLIQDSSKRSSIIQQVYANLTNPILINLRNPTIPLFDDALWCLVYFFNLFSTLKYLRPFPNGDMWNPQRFTCSWSWMISRKAHPPWAPSLAGFPQWLGVSKSRCFLRVQFPQKVFWRMRMLAGIWSKGRLGFFGCPDGDAFLQKIQFLDLVHDRWGPAGKATPESRGPWFLFEVRG